MWWWLFILNVFFILGIFTDAGGERQGERQLAGIILTIITTILLTQNY